MGAASGCYPLASPGGKLPDLTALRNRQGWLMRGGERLKSPQQYVEWCNLEHMLLIQLHSLTNLSPPLISLATLSSFPPGEAKGQLRELVPFNVPLSSICQRVAY